MIPLLKGSDFLFEFDGGGFGNDYRTSKNDIPTQIFENKCASTHIQKIIKFTLDHRYLISGSKFLVKNFHF